MLAPVVGAMLPYITELSGQIMYSSKSNLLLKLTAALTGGKL
jgi:hypothetical protein